MRYRDDYRNGQKYGKYAGSEFHQQRLRSIQNKKGLLDVTDSGAITYHVIPGQSFGNDELYQIDVEDVDRSRLRLPENPYAKSTLNPSHRDTATGIAHVKKVMDKEEDLVDQYVHLSTTGIIEIGNSRIVRSKENGQNEILSSKFEATIVNSIQTYVSFLSELGCGDSYEIHLTLFNVENIQFTRRNSFGHAQSNKFNSCEVAPFPVSVPPTKDDLAMWKCLRQLLSGVWRSAGYSSLPTENADGGWALEGEY